MNRLNLLLPVVVTLLAGCANQTLEPQPEVAYEPASRSERVDYLSEINQGSDALLLPPNVIEDDTNQLLLINEEERILPTLQSARILKAGNSRWAEIDLAPREAWPVIRQFWINQGFGIEAEVPEIGIIETDWQQDRSQIIGIGLTKYIDQALNRLHDTGERHKFRTRIEHGSKPNTTLVYISFRGIAEQSVNKFARLPHDPTLEAEMLRRLLLEFRLPEESLATVASLDQQAQQLNEYVINGSSLTILMSFNDAWQRVGLALDRSGFTVDKSDIESGVYLIRYLEDLPQANENKQQGLFGGFFSTDDKVDPTTAIYELKLANENDSDSILQAPNNQQGEKIISLIAQNF